MDTERFVDACYEAYQLDWMISHGHSLEDLFNEYQDCLEDDLLENGWVSDADEVDSAMDNAREGFLDRGFGGSIYVCKDEFLGAEFRDPDYMDHLFRLMPPGEDYRKLYQEVTGIYLPDEEKIEISTSAGNLRAYTSKNPDQPGICVMLNPAGSEDEIDVSYVSVYEDPEYALNGERPVDVSIMTYADPYSEDYTDKKVLKREDVIKALELDTE